MKPPKTRTANFSESVLRHLNAYAVAAGAAGVGMLAATPAGAQVVYTPVKVTLSLAGTSEYDLNPAGSAVAPFRMFAGFTSPGIYWDTLSFNPNSNGARFVQGPGTSWSIAPLKPGFVINGNRHFGARNRGLMATYGPYGGGTYNNHDGFKFGQTTFIGFKFQISGQIHYGWARVVVRFDPNTPKRKIYLQLTGYAYEATANKSIKAGQTSGTAAMMEPAQPDPSLGVLALGSEGLSSWRAGE